MAHLPLKSMTIEEKLQAMEELWADICASAGVEPPDWHQSVVRDRDESRKRGEQTVEDWESAKSRILKELP